MNWWTSGGIGRTGSIYFCVGPDSPNILIGVRIAMMKWFRGDLNMQWEGEVEERSRSRCGGG
jgi:hypothetical protein